MSIFYIPLPGGPWPFSDPGNLAMEDDLGRRVVIVTRACDLLGIDAGPQIAALQRSGWADCALSPLPDDMRDYLVLRLDALPMWLLGIETSRAEGLEYRHLAAWQEAARALLATGRDPRGSLLRAAEDVVGPIDDLIEP